MNTQWQNPLALVGRILLAVIFVVSGFGKLMAIDGTVAYMTSGGVPMANLLVYAVILVELVGGLLIMVGYQTRVVALIVFLFLIPVTLLFHNPSANPAQAQMQTIQLLKNLAIMGGMLNLMAFGAGGWSLDGRRRS
ncbi:putative oxidoreductase [Actimicrobium sp. GrIS 1.19]|uniref:DoxX family protein n=1 Tax=Actimicrobium sp. GrIS 1.19 TaxID=3071708 RepID=UPI002E00E575|nr:putative oxidoreductase [Actimicrobium sp. GrIS 1.19]